MNTLDSPQVAQLLQQLSADAHTTDAPIIAKVRERVAQLGKLDDADPQIAEALGGAFIPVSLPAGRLLYTLACANGARTLVEFGTSFGLSTIHLAAAAKDNSGRVITTELHPGKQARARAHLEAAGLVDYVEFRLGDARETLRDLQGEVDFLFLDGWKALYLSVFEVVAPRLRRGAVVVADDLDIAPDLLRPYLERVRAPGSGYASVEITIGDAMELSVRC